MHHPERILMWMTVLELRYDCEAVIESERSSGVKMAT